MKYRVLWIEDGAFVEVSRLPGPVYTSMMYDFEVATNVTDGIQKIKSTEYHAIIVDIRIPPGIEENWDSLYQKSKRNRNLARLGIQMLFSLLKPQKAKVKISDIPPWVRKEKFAILSIEAREELEEDLKELKIVDYCYQKSINMPDTILLDIINKVIARQEKVEKEELKG